MKIHTTAIVSPHAKIADDVEVGPYSIIGDHVELRRGVKVGAHAVIENWTTIGEQCRIYTGACIGIPPQDLKYKNEQTFLEIGARNIIREYVTINPGTEKNSKTVIGDDNLIMAYSHIAHDCRVGNGNIFANNATLGGYVHIADKVTLGGLSAIHQFVRVGSYAIIGGCAKAVQDIVPFSMSDGHRARIYGLNRVGLLRAKFSSQEILSLRRAFKILFSMRLSIPSALNEIARSLPADKNITMLVDFIKASKRGITN
jgi:UDP-N-acetylglucosamine acyltransferase